MKDIKPKILFTLGDPAGIGPEVSAKVLCDDEIMDQCQIVIVGDPDLAEMAFDLVGLKRDVSFEKLKVGDKNPTPSQRGRYQFEVLKRAIEMTLAGEADAVVTAPISKDALYAAGLDFPGHTEILGKFCHCRPVMMLMGGPLRVVPLTTHCALKQVPELLDKKEVYDISLAVYRGLQKDFGIKEPRLLLTGLNPHAGEGGLFGTEEIEILSPAVDALLKEGVNIKGPVPADTAFYKAAMGDFDVVIAPTHDQALIPLKLLAFAEAVNVTLNLPIVRVSPGHGTALDIAWTGTANPSSMKAATRTAIEIVNNRKKK